MSSVLNLQGVSLTRSGQRILHDVTWATDSGQHWVIMGPNGAGKTSLVRVATGREAADEGEVVILGTPVGEHPVGNLATAIGLSSQSVASRLRPGQSARECVRTAAWGQTRSFDEEYEESDTERANDLLAAFGVGHVADRRFSSLSEGERQRVLLARALMTDPEVVILDEPTAGLDLGARELLLRALSEIIAGPRAPQLILVTHQIEEIPAGFTHAALMADGQVTHAGPIDEVLTGVNLSMVFGLPLNVTHADGRWHAHAPRDE